MMFAIIGETFDEENIARRKIRKRAIKKGRPLLKDKRNWKRALRGSFFMVKFN